MNTLGATKIFWGKLLPTLVPTVPLIDPLASRLSPPSLALFVTLWPWWSSLSTAIIINHHDFQLLPVLGILLDPHRHRPFYWGHPRSLFFGQICFAAIDEEKKSTTFVTSIAGKVWNTNPITPPSIAPPRAWASSRHAILPTSISSLRPLPAAEFLGGQQSKRCATFVTSQKNKNIECHTHHTCKRLTLHDCVIWATQWYSAERWGF